jgi:hypothetical protein
MQEAMAYYVGYRKETPTRKEIRCVYESLTKGHMIGHAKGTGGMIITILKYNEYQNPENYEGHDEGPHEKEVEGTSYNKERKIKNVKNNTLPKGNVSEEVSPDHCPHQKIRQMFNEKFPNLPHGKHTNKTFDAMLRARWREDEKRQSMEWWYSFFEYVKTSDFLMGRTEKPFSATFEWIIRPTNMTKILNGNYHTKKNNAKIINTRTNGNKQACVDFINSMLEA